MRIAVVIIVIAVLFGVAIGAIRLLLGVIGGGDIGGSLGAGTDGGLYASNDGGLTFVQRAQANLPEGQNEGKSFARFDVFDLLEDPVQAGRWWVATEGAGLFRSGNQGADWEATEGPNAILTEAIVRSIARDRGNLLLLALDGSGRGRIWKSTDDATSFREVYSAAHDGVRVNTLSLPLQTPSTVLAGLSDGLVIGSSDSGETWTALTQFPRSVRKITFSPSDPAVLYAIVEASSVSRSTDGGRTWEELGRRAFGRDEETQLPGEPLSKFGGGRDVLAMAIHPQDARHVLLASGSGLLRSTDGGDHFVQLPVPLLPEALPVRSVSFDPQSPTTLYVTAGDGLYTSYDDGKNWRVTRFTIRPKLTIVGVSVSDRNTVLVGTSDR